MQETFDAKLALQNGLISKIVVGNNEAKEICKKISSYSSQVSVYQISEFSFLKQYDL